jgi:purine nucleosidase
MQKRQIIIDCDPGQDDAINLLLAMSSPKELDILGITTVAGNVPLELTSRNARLICDLAGRDDIQVFAGSAHPLQRDLVTAEHAHGKTGLNGIEIREPRHPLEEKHAVDFIIDTLRTAKNKSITLVATGPLTNIAIAIEKDPSILGKVAEIVLMGGAMREGGNASPSAEFNIFVDPHAADIVFRSGLVINVLGLDVTYKLSATQKRKDRIHAIGNEVSHAAVRMLDLFDRFAAAKYSPSGVPLNDPSTIGFLLKRDLFIGKRCNLIVETQSELTMGHTAVDFWHVTDQLANVNWIHSVDADGFYDLLVERLAQF